MRVFSVGLAALRGAPLLLSLLLLAPTAWGKEPNRLYRIDLRPHAGYTRLGLKLERPADYTVSHLPGNRVRITLPETDGGRWKRLRAYSDPHIGGCTVTRRGDDLQVTVAVKGDARGVRVFAPEGAGVLTVDVGSALAPRQRSPLNEGREGIRAGVEQLVTRFDPPIRSEIPFVPTDRRVLEKMVPPEVTEQVLTGEAALYRGLGSEAEEIFAPLAAKQSPIRPLALYRLGEARYMLQKYGDALRDLREGAQLWPQFLSISPATTFAYADSIVRGGDLAGGRRLLGQLIAALADRQYAPTLLVRLADILARQGKEMEAVAIYRTVAEGFPGKKAAWHARLKLADRRLVALEPTLFGGLAVEYQEIYQHGGDLGLREEGLFKSALLTALYGEAGAGFALVAEYGKKFPQGIYAGVARGMREELLVPLWRRLAEEKDHAGLVKLAQDNKEYLTRCLADPDFIVRLSEAFAALGQPREETDLFAFLAGKEWSAASGPELYRRIIADAQLLADQPLLEKAAGDFLGKFPSHPSTPGYREQLAALEYHRGEMSRVIARLSDLLAGKRRPETAESLYYLGKALDGAGNRKDAERAMTLFVSEIRQRGAQSELAPDAWYVAASARLSRGDRKGAAECLRTGCEAAPEGGRDLFLYKLGEVARAEGRNEEAAKYFQTVVKEGKDPDWQKMATQALADMELRRKLAGKVSLSKK